MNEHIRHVNVEKFAMAVERQTEAIAQGDFKSGNRWARVYLAAFAELRKEGDEGREALCALLSHHRSDVRVMAATFLLKYRTDDCLAVLEKEAVNKGLAALGAAEAIRRWEEGNWNLDFD